MRIHRQIGNFDCIVHSIRCCIDMKAILKKFDLSKEGRDFWICLIFEPCKLDGGGRMEGSLVAVEWRKPWHF